MKKYLGPLLIVSVFILGIFIRTTRFNDRVFFTLEQGITLDTTYSYLHERLSLLGLPNVQRFTSMGHRIFSGPLFNYLLMPFMMLFGTDPIRMTYVAVLINILTALLLFLLISKLSGKRVALFASILFLFDPTMIDQSLTLWILNPLPLLGLIGMYILLKNTKPYSLISIFFLGLLCGTLTSLEYMGIFTSILIFIYLWYVNRSILRITFAFGIGFLLPLLPTMVFDFRNDFYHLRTLTQYTLDTLHNPGQGTPRIYHFYHFIPLITYLGAITLNWILTKSRYVVMILLILYVSINSYRAYSRLPIISTPNLLSLSNAIAQNAKTGYNVVYMPEAEYRGYAVRYMLNRIHKSTPLPIDAYPSSTELYVIKTPDRDLDTDIPWEISSFEPKESHLIYTTNDKQAQLIRLSK